MILGVLVFFAVGLSHAAGFLQYVFRFGFEDANTQAQAVAVTSTQMTLFLGTQFLTAAVFSFRNQLARHLWLAFGVLVWTAGVIGTSFTTTYDQLFGVYATLVGVGSSILYWGPLAMAMRSQRETLVVLAFASLGELVHFWVVAPYLALPIWRQTMLILGCCGAGLMLPCILLSYILTPKPSSTKAPERPTFLTPGFAILTIAALCFNTVAATPYQQLVNFLTYERGIDRYHVSLTMGMFSLAGLVGRIIPLPLLMVSNDPMFFLLLTTLVSILVPSGWFLVQEFVGGLLFAVFAGMSSSMQSSFLMAAIAKLTDNPFVMTPISIISMAFACVLAGYFYTEVLLFGGFHVAAGILVGFQSLSFLLTSVAYLLLT